MMESEVFIVDALRTPIGRLGGDLSSVRADDLGALAIRALVERTGIPPEIIDDVIFGCANQAGEDNRNVARMALLLAGLPDSVPGVTVNRLCGSSLEAISMAARCIRAGEAEVLIAGGVESMSRAPLVLAKPDKAFQTGTRNIYDSSLGWRFPNPKMEKMFPLEAMGETAENIAERWNITRQDQDAFALGSHEKALAAQKAGHFSTQLVPVTIPRRKGDDIRVDRDEGPRADTSLEKLASLRPVFRKGGSVTAGNSSTLNDGSAAVLVCSKESAKKYGLKPKVRYLAGAAAGVDPRIMGTGPVPAMKKALKLSGLSLSDIDLFELNEAFAAQSLCVIRELGLPEDRVNVNGGAIALGHPLGCSGARITTTLIHLMMADPRCRRGAATMCIGVGQGVATIFEKV